MCRLSGPPVTFGPPTGLPTLLCCILLKNRGVDRISCTARRCRGFEIRGRSMYTERDGVVRVVTENRIRKMSVHTLPYY